MKSLSTEIYQILLSSYEIEDSRYEKGKIFGVVVPKIATPLLINTEDEGSMLDSGYTERPDVPTNIRLQ